MENQNIKWVSVKFKNFVQLQRGFDLPEHSRQKGTCPVVASTSIVDYHDEYKVKAPCITTGRSGALGEVLYINQNSWPLNTTLWVKDFKGNDPKFVYYKLKTLGLEKFNAGVGVPTLNRNHLDELNINIPLKAQDQSCIASILSGYDDLVKVSENRIKLLEEMAERLYTEWFVRFKFRGQEKVRVVDSGTEFGKIPEEWEVKALGEVMHFVRGRSYSSEQISNTEGDYYIVNLKSFNRGGGFRFDGEKYYSGPVNDNQHLEQGDVVVALTDMTNDRVVIARPARVPHISSQRITFSADLVKMISKKIPSSFIYYCLLDHRFTETTKQKANGANVLHLKPAAILEYRAVIPPIDMLNEFEKKCHEIFGLIDASLQLNQCLAKTRDLLIPQLITGRRLLKN